MIHFVLVNPEGPENVGAAARAMLNMGFDSLILADPVCDHLSESSLKYSVHAKRVLQAAQVFPDLSSAVKNTGLTVAISRRIGQWRKRDLTSSELGEFLSNYNDKDIHLVFGRERDGLTTEEIHGCDVVCSIPTADEYTSLNLAQAVMVIAYEIHRYQSKISSKAAVNTASRESFDAAHRQILDTFQELNYFKYSPEESLGVYFKKLMLRARLEEEDTVIIRNVFTRVQGMIKRLKKKHSNLDKN